MIGIYGIRNKTNNKIYVGKSIQLQIRLGRHKNDLNKNKHFNKHLQSAYNKYGGDSFEFVVLEETQAATAEEMITKEQYWVDHYKATGVYNKSLDVTLRPGDSFLGKEHTPSTKEKMSLAKIGKYFGGDNPNFGKRWSPEKRVRNMLKHPTTKLQESDVVEIVQLLKDGELKDCDIADKFNVSRTVITRIANGTRWSHVTGGKIMKERRGIRNIGKPRSESTREKISKSLKGA